MKQVGERGSGTRGRLLPRLTALGVLAMAFGVPWQFAQAQPLPLVSCNVSQYNCTSNDAQGVTITPTTIDSCVVGEMVDVPVTVNVTTTGGTTRYDIGAWFRSEVAGQCQNAFTTVGTSNFQQLESKSPQPFDTCGDLSRIDNQEATGTQTFTVKVLCQPDSTGKIPLSPTVYWSASDNGGTCNPYPGGPAKCATVPTTVTVIDQSGKCLTYAHAAA